MLKKSNEPAVVTDTEYCPLTHASQLEPGVYYQMRGENGLIGKSAKLVNWPSPVTVEGENLVSHFCGKRRVMGFG